MSNSTTLQIPPNLDDNTVLRRVLTKIVSSIDELKGFRGKGKAASESQLVTTAQNVEDLAKDINSLDLSFLRKDGKNKAEGIISYAKSYNFKGLNIVTAEWVDKYSVTKEYLQETLSKYLKLKKKPAPAVLNSTDSSDMKDKINELIDTLKQTGIIS